MLRYCRWISTEYTAGGGGSMVRQRHNMNHSGKKNGIAGAPSRNEPIIALWDSIVFIQQIDVFEYRDVHIKVRRVVLD